MSSNDNDYRTEEFKRLSDALDRLYDAITEPFIPLARKVTEWIESKGGSHEN